MILALLSAEGRASNGEIDKLSSLTSWLRRMRPSQLIIASILLASPFTGSSVVAGESELSADLILFNARVWTADESSPYAEALAIRGSKMYAVSAYGTDIDLV